MSVPDWQKFGRSDPDHALLWVRQSPDRRIAITGMSTLYISDLDGTLVNNDAVLSPYALKELNAMLAEGLQLTVASARSIVSMQQMLAGLELRLPVIGFNGAFLSDLKTGAHLHVNSMPREIAESIIACLPAYDCAPYVSTYTGAEERVYYDTVTNAGMQWYWRDRIERRDPRFRHQPRYLLAHNDAVTCITIIHRGEVLDALEADLISRFGTEVEIHQYENQYSPGWYWLTVHDRRASKDQAIKVLQAHQDLKDSRVVVFGDNKNDIKMFQAADLAVAVENAQAQVKAHAHEVIGSNLNDAVVNYLRANWTPV